MPTSPELKSLLVDFWSDLQDLSVLWQIGVLAAALAAAWIAGRAIQPRLTTADGTRHLGHKALAGVQFPLTALVVVLVGRAIIAHWQSVNLLNLVVPLLVALAIVRCVVVMLRQVFPDGTWQKSAVRAIGWVVWIGFALHVTGLAPDLIRFLDGAGIPVGKHRITLLLVLQAALSVLATVLVALWLGRVVEGRLMQAGGLDINLRVMFSKLAQAVLIVLAILIALPAVGIDLTVLSVFGGMLGVGIGFGLQKIASNYVSGFIILMDRSVSISDLVSVGEHTGELTKMTARYVVLRHQSGTEAIIPNETMITSTVVNHSYTDRRVRVPVPVTVGHGAHLDTAMGLLEDIGRRHARVLADPAPKALVRQFTEGGLELELGVWIDDPLAGQHNLRSDLYREIWREFQAQGVPIAQATREYRLVHTAAEADKN